VLSNASRAIKLDNEGAQNKRGADDCLAGDERLKGRPRALELALQ
jgi:hypothetical protein